jgi:hypothetical protein
MRSKFSSLVEWNICLKHYIFWFGNQHLCFVPMTGDHTPAEILPSPSLSAYFVFVSSTSERSYGRATTAIIVLV